MEDAVAEELDLVLAPAEESAHDLAVGSEHSAAGVVTSSQSCRSVDGGCKGQMADGRIATTRAWNRMVDLMIDKDIRSMEQRIDCTELTMLETSALCCCKPPLGFKLFK